MIKKKHISRLHYITHPADNKPFLMQIEEACRAGADWIQLRAKDHNSEELEKLVQKAKKICSEYEAVLIINDHVDIAAKINADGVHLGKNDMNPLDARSILGENKIIGGTADCFEMVQQLADSGVDYIGLGPFCYTSTKKKLSKPLGLDGYRDIISKCRTANITTPVIAIGGIQAKNIKELHSTGIHGVAVSSAINQIGSIFENTKIFLSALESNRL